MNMLRISPVGAMDIRQGCSKTALGPKGRLTLQELLDITLMPIVPVILCRD